MLKRIPKSVTATDIHESINASPLLGKELMAKILIIDDDAELRSTLIELLTTSGHEVRGAENGVVGLAAARAELPEVFIVDLMMPQKDGLTTIQELLLEFPRARVIAISGGPSGNPSWLPIAKNAGALAILKKPFTFERLREEVQAALENPWR